MACPNSIHLLQAGSLLLWLLADAKHHYNLMTEMNYYLGKYQVSKEIGCFSLLPIFEIAPLVDD